MDNVLIQAADGILVPGGFGDRGVQGKILAAKYARENKVPYLGLCLGMQIAVIEFARSVLKLPHANSTEFVPDAKTPCIIFMPEVNKCINLCMLLSAESSNFCCLTNLEFYLKGSKTHMGGTMRLGSRRTHFVTTNCKAARL